MTVCLSMIVKDEAKIIERCLMAARPFIDAWIVVDTGSTDGTQNLVRETMYGIPGELHEQPWVDFSTNRNQALELARPWADYVLLLDADMELEGDDKDLLRKLTDPLYSMQQVRYRDSFAYFNIRLVRQDLPAQYEGVLHEYLKANTSVTKLHGIRILDHDCGERTSHADKFQRDVVVLRKALAADPTNARYTYYLAQSLRDAGELAEAARVYRQRAAMPGWTEETWSAMYENGRLQEKIRQNPRNAYLAAYQYNPKRAEPLCQLARYHRERGEHALSYLYAKQGVTIPYPDAILFIEEDVYKWRMRDELSVAGYYVGAFDEGRAIIQDLLQTGAIPDSERPRLEGNLKLFLTQ